MDDKWPLERLRRMAVAYDCKLPNRPRTIDDLVSEISSSTADTIERLTKDNQRLDCGWCEAVETLARVRRDRNEAQGRIVELEVEVERLRGDLEKWKDWSGSLPSSWFAR